MNVKQKALRFHCNNLHLYGILSIPANPSERGVLIVVGGPQYRVGSHRQFVSLANYLAGTGTPVMRFDYRGMGDSEGESCSFELAGDDIRDAINQFFAELPYLKEVVLLGLCDGATAAAFYARKDARVSGLVLLNPWVRTDVSQAKAYLKHYYAARLFDRSFWRKVGQGRINVVRTARSLCSQILIATTRLPPTGSNQAALANVNCVADASLSERLLNSLICFKGYSLVILGGKDLTAHEFIEVQSSSQKWKKLMASPRMQYERLAGADHTFSRQTWQTQMFSHISVWLHTW